MDQNLILLMEKLASEHARRTVRYNMKVASATQMGIDLAHDEMVKEAISLGGIGKGLKGIGSKVWGSKTLNRAASRVDEVMGWGKKGLPAGPVRNVRPGAATMPQPQAGFAPTQAPSGGIQPAAHRGYQGSAPTPAESLRDLRERVSRQQFSTRASSAPPVPRRAVPPPIPADARRPPTMATAPTMNIRKAASLEKVSLSFGGIGKAIKGLAGGGAKGAVKKPWLTWPKAIVGAATLGGSAAAVGGGMLAAQKAKQIHQGYQHGTQVRGGPGPRHGHAQTGMF